MSYNLKKTDWIGPFSIDYLPKWNCANCNSGILELYDKENNFIILETSESRESHGQDPKFNDYRFTSFLLCSICSTISIMGGQAVMVETVDRDGTPYDSYRITPWAFNPGPRIIKIPQQCSSEVKKAVIESFNLFFTDATTCSNSIRKAVERLMDDFKIKKTGKNKNFLPLHNRIDEFINKNKDKHLKAGEALKAIKWIGNTGSHQSKITQGDVLDSYQLLYYAFDLLFLKSVETVVKIAETINKKKKPRSYSKTKRKKVKKG